MYHNGCRTPAITILPVPFSPGQVLIALAVLIPALVIFNLLLISEEVFESIGFGFCQAMLMTAGALLGSLFNIPLIPVDNAVIAINVGGAAIPLFVTIEMVARNRISLKRPSPPPSSYRSSLTRLQHPHPARDHHAVLHPAACGSRHRAPSRPRLPHRS